MITLIQWKEFGLSQRVVSVVKRWISYAKQPPMRARTFQNMVYCF
jgi:hypothetical protein